MQNRDSDDTDKKTRRDFLASGIAGIAGVALSQIDNVSPNLGQSYIIDSFMVVVFGGVGMNEQEAALRAGVEILVATPGRLLDHAGNKTNLLNQVKFLVLDEADRMLDLGFIHALKRIVKLVPRQRQTLLFSATMPSAIAAEFGDAAAEPTGRTEYLAALQLTVGSLAETGERLRTVPGVRVEPHRDAVLRGNLRTADAIERRAGIGNLDEAGDANAAMDVLRPQGGLLGAQRVVVHHFDELGERCMMRQLLEAQA